MRGELCIGVASALTAAAVGLLIAVHVGQVSTSFRTIDMAKVNVSGYGNALYAAFSDPILGLYTNNASAPLNVRAGLRQVYKFGLYSHCAYVNETAGLCTSKSPSYEFQPYTVITNDMLSNYSGYTNAIIHNSTFANSASLGASSRAAYGLLLLAAILAVISFVTGMFKRAWAFFLSTFSAIAASIFVLAGSALWTAAIKRAEQVNLWTIDVQSVQVPLGIEVSAGVGLYLAWAAFACLVTSVIPYMISCCTFRG